MNSTLKKHLSITAGSVLLASFAPFAIAASPTAIGWISSPKLYEIHTWAGKSEWGRANGPLNQSTFFHPHSVASLPDGKLLVSDSGNHLLRVVSSQEVSAFSGLDLGEDDAGLPAAGYNDDVLAMAAYSLPSGVAVDARGVIYIADAGNHAIRKIAVDGTVTTLAGNGTIGTTDGKGIDARFDSPSDVAVDANGNVYVADTLNHAIRKITADGTVTTLNAASTRNVEYVPGAVENVGDFLDGPIASAKFNEPSGLAIDNKGNLYVSDRGNQRVRYIDFVAGTVTTVAGGGSYGSQAVYVEGDFADGSAASSRLNAPEGLTVTADGTVVVADSLNHAIRLIRGGQVSTLAGEPTEFGQADGVTGSAQFNHPTDVALLPDGRLAIADENGNKVRVLQKYAKPASLPLKGISVLWQGELVKSDAQAQMKSNWVFIPLRSVGDALGFTVMDGTKEKNATATLTKGDIAYSLTNGSKTVTKTVKGQTEQLTLNAAPFIANHRMFVPIRFFAEQEDLDIQWDQSSQIVVIRSKVQ